MVLSFILAGVGCVFAGLCYAEFASMIPVAGSAYTYGYATLGEIVAWIIGWDLILEYAFGAATVASGWSGYVVSFLQDFGILIPPSLASTPGTQWVEYQGKWALLTRIGPVLQQAGVDPATLPHATGAFNVVAFLGIAIVTAILIYGIKESANFNSFIVIVKVFVLLVFIGLGGAYIMSHMGEAKQNWTPFLPPNEGEYGKYGISGVARAAGGDLLCVHRLRRGVYRGAGGKESAARHADRNSRIAGHLHDSLHSRRGRADRTREVHGAGRVGPDRDRHRQDGCAVGQLPREARRDRGLEQHDGGDVARPVAHLLFDVARRSAAAVGEQGSPEVPHAVSLVHLRGHLRRDLRGADSRRHPG